MLQQVVVQSSTPVEFDIDSVDPDEVLIIQSISGLSPADVTLFMGEFARDGGYYQGRRVSKRNPVITFKINPDYANDIEVSDVREQLYRMFLEPQSASDGVQVLLKDDRKPDRYFIGYTEKLEAEIFSKSTLAQVSMVCSDPYLRSAEETIIEGSVGLISTDINYDGSADTGVSVVLVVTVAGNSVSATINGKTMTVNYSEGFSVGDKVSINTNPGTRWVMLNDTVDILAGLTADSEWWKLSQPVNTMHSTNAYIEWVWFRSAWWGI